MNQLNRRNPFNNLSSVLVIIVVLVGLFFLVRGIFRLLYFLAPILLILTLVLNYRVVVDFVKYVFRMVRENPVVGIGMILLTLIAYPVVFAYLLAKAYLSRNNKEAAHFGSDSSYDEYEDITEESLDLNELDDIEIEDDRSSQGYFRE